MAKTYASVAASSLKPADASSIPKKLKGQRWADLSDSDDDDFVPATRHPIADITSGDSCGGGHSDHSDRFDPSDASVDAPAKDDPVYPCSNEELPSKKDASVDASAKDEPVNPCSAEDASVDASAKDEPEQPSVKGASVDASAKDEPVDRCSAEDGDRDSDAGANRSDTDNVTEVGTELTDGASVTGASVTGASVTASIAPSTASPGSSKLDAATQDDDYNYIISMRASRRKRKTKQREKKLLSWITEREKKAAAVVAFQLAVADRAVDLLC